MYIHIYASLSIAIFQICLYNIVLHENFRMIPFIMKTFSHIVIFFLSVFLGGCGDDKQDHRIKFATSADYPPFEYHENGEIKGFDIDLARFIGKELGKEVIFEDMRFGAILGALQSGSVDAAISTITTTEEREKNFDFSDSYYKESLAIVYPKDRPLVDKAQLSKKKIACQLGTTMEIWLKNHVLDAEISSMDNNGQAIEALKSGYVDGVFIDSIQARAFCQKNPKLYYSVIAQSDLGYAIVMQKGSPLKDKVNKILRHLEKEGVLEELRKKWFDNVKWKS